MDAMNLTGCSEMSSTYTFLVTVQEEENKIPHLVDEYFLRDYLWAIIESRNEVAVLSIVRDY